MGYKILLADDSVTVQKIITLTFSDEGVDVLTVNNGDEAIHRLQYLRPALVMADVSIPGKNGYEICEFVKNHPEMKDTPVILLVPAFEPFDEERARRIGADHHLTKPFQSIRTLISTVKGLLESHPPKISTPLTTTGSLIKPAEPPAVSAPVETAAPIETPNLNGARNLVQDTQPFPGDLEEEMPPVAIASALEAQEVLEVDQEAVSESPASQSSEPEPADVELQELPPEPRLETASEPVESRAAAPEELELPISLEEWHTAPATLEEEPPVAASAASQELVTDLDHVLDLDDVLPEVWSPAPLEAAPEAAQPAMAGTTTEIPAETATVTIPQAVIDEIVSRVVAQLSEKLAGSLAGTVAEKLATQLVPEVADLVKHQPQHEPIVQPLPASLGRESDSLLDLD